MFDVYTLIFVVLSALIFLIFLVPLAKIISKAGYSGWWCLIWFVPIGNFVMLWVFAFADWPALRQPRA